MRRILSLLVLALVIGSTPAAAMSDCPPVSDITCDGWVTDKAGVVSDDLRLEEAAGRIVEATGHEIAVVVVDGAPGGAAQLAIDIGNGWGVGDAARDDGIVVVIDLDARRTEISTGPGVNLPNVSFLASLGDSFFGAGDFDGGIQAILGGIEASLSGSPADPNADQSPPGDSFYEPPSIPFSNMFGSVLAIIVFLSFYSVIRGAVRTHRAVRSRLAETDGKKERVAMRLRRLEPAGHELILGTDFLLPQPELNRDVTTGAGLAMLRSIAGDQPVAEGDSLDALWALDVVDALDADLIDRYRQIPLELVVSDEQQLLEDAVQEAASTAKATKVGPELDVALAELDRLVAALKPYRVAEARTRLTRDLAMKAAPSPIGPLVVTDLGERFLRVAPVLDSNRPLSESISEITDAYSLASEKTRRVERVRASLEDPTSAGAVSVALADVGEDVDQTLAEYERLLDRLEDSQPAKDGISTPALAAFLLMNNDTTAVRTFLDAYTQARAIHPAGTAVEYALAGLQTRAELDEARAAATELDLPVAIAVALTRQGERAVSTFHHLKDQLVDSGVTGDNLRTIAALLALSLEPSAALDAWLEARRALHALGLSGAYADVAAAFGASDPRGPRAFAVAYAAQRQALARSGIDDADRFAPELAHAGTSGRTDSWTGRRIPAGLGSYDPFTFLYYHWVMTGGTGYGSGWAPIYRDHSWSNDSDSWFGGGGGFGSSGSWSGGSSWGSSWGGSGGFGGFSGGGGFSSGGGSSW